MKTKLLITLVFSFVFLQLSAQESYIKNRWNIKLAYQKETKFSNSLWTRINPYYHLVADFGILQNLELGVNTAYSPSAMSNTQRLKYNINSNFQVLPFFTTADDFRLDFGFGIRLR